MSQYPSDKARVPCDRAAFWSHLCTVLKGRFPTCDTDDGCIAWLEKHVGVEGKTIQRWAGKATRPTRPQWQTVEEIATALNRNRPAGTAPLTAADLVRGLPDASPAPQPGGGATSGRPAAPQALGAGNLQGLLAKVEDILRRAPALAAALASKGYAQANTVNLEREVAGALAKERANKVAADVAELAATPLHRDAARNLLWHILPLAARWDDLLKKAGATATPGDVMELGLRTETVAEIVLACIEDRPCYFAAGDGNPQGAAHVPLPAMTSAPFFDPNGHLLRNAVLGNLYRERSLDEPWRHLKKDCVNEEEFVEEAAAEINTRTLQDTRRYLLAIDVKLGAQGIEDRDAWWASARDALRAALPGLRLVRLTAERTDYESNIRLLVKRVHNRS